ncbi:MAG: ABC transporter ATP-binding protein [Desulfovibrionaceae bacterium]|nr:ABC transporter ATP-binding protein [Desulfovibrionaceae bacterium]MBF0514586.1 ABC transporter ATP-binding protein [Desulfovibrionaceae bacterium]
MSNYKIAGKSGGPVVEVADLIKTYVSGEETISVLKGINLKIFAGEMVAIMGPSGSGKSTLLFILGIFLAPTSGVYKVCGVDVFNLSRPQQAAFRRERMGFVFQSCDLLENSTVYENLELPLIYAGVRRRERPHRIKEALQRVSLEHRIQQPSNRLSGGERQRVAIARALVNQPEFILADEPTGQLDRENSQRVMDYFAKIADEAHTAMAVVTHDATTADRCTRICMLQDGFLVGDTTPIPREDQSQDL